MDCSLPGSSVHGISQARILEWVAISFSRGSLQPRIEPTSPLWQADSLPLSHREAHIFYLIIGMTCGFPTNQSLSGDLHRFLYLVPRAEPILSKAAVIIDINNQINPLHKNLSPNKCFRIGSGDHLELPPFSVTLSVCLTLFLSFDGSNSFILSLSKAVVLCWGQCLQMLLTVNAEEGAVLASDG